MAATAAAARLTEAHRLAQARLGARTVSQLFAVSDLLDPADLGGTVQRWLSVALPVIGAARRTSATLAANYWLTFRTLELGEPGTATPVVADALDRSAATTSLVVTGPARIRSAVGPNTARAAVVAKAETARAGTRHALNGGRDTIVESVKADRQALGWARATSGKPCHFCALLASRGPVYSKATGEFRCHDGCHCTVEPVYRRDADWPSGGRRYQQLWQESTAGQSGADAVNAFRRALAGT